MCTDILELKSTLAGQAKSALTHYSGDFYTYENTVEEQRKNQARARVAYEKEKEKLREFISRSVAVANIVHVPSLISIGM